MAEIIDLGSLDSIPTFTLGGSSGGGGGSGGGASRSSSNFGGGIELLMNDKFKGGDSGRKNSSSGDIDLGELADLENELNDLSNVPKRSSSIFGSGGGGSGEDKSSGGGGDDSGGGGGGFGSFFKINRSDDNKDNGVSNLGSSTANTDNNARTWDGYGKFNDIPLDPDATVDPTPQMSKDEMIKEKFKLLRKLEELEQKGVQLTKRYSMDSSYSEMKGEYDTQIEERERQNSV